MSETHNAERRWALTWQSGLERQSPPLVEELRTLVRTVCCPQPVTKAPLWMRRAAVLR